MQTEMTPLDLAHDDMQRGAEAERLKFYETVLDSELILWLEEPSDGTSIAPQILPHEGHEFVLVFDQDERLATAAGHIVDKATLAGRALISMIAGQGLGLAVNLGAAPSAILIGPDGVDWMAEIMAKTAIQDKDLSQESREARAVELAQSDLPPIVLARLAEKLGASAGMAECAVLVKATFEDQESSHILAFIGADSADHAALVEAANQAIAFSGLSDETIVDVTFVEAGSTQAERLLANGHRLSMERAAPRARAEPVAPGSDPDAPPKLR